MQRRLRPAGEVHSSMALADARQKSVAGLSVSSESWSRRGQLGQKSLDWRGSVVLSSPRTRKSTMLWQSWPNGC